MWGTRITKLLVQRTKKSQKSNNVTKNSQRYTMEFQAGFGCSTARPSELAGCPVSGPCGAVGGSWEVEGCGDVGSGQRRCRDGWEGQPPPRVRMEAHALAAVLFRTQAARQVGPQFASKTGFLTLFCTQAQQCSQIYFATFPITQLHNITSKIFCKIVSYSWE